MANKKTPGVAKKKVNWKTYLRNTWQLYVMMLIPIIWLICFKYKPMLYIVVAFKKYNIFKGIWESPWVGFKYFKTLYFYILSFANTTTTKISLNYAKKPQPRKSL